MILPAIIDPLAIFLLRQNMLTIPKSYDESAYMDGAGRFRIYRSIIFPMCMPSIVVVLVTRALVLWNDFFQPLIFISEYKNIGFDRVKGTGGIWLRKHFDRSGRRGNEFYSPSAALYFLSEKVNECYRFSRTQKLT